MEEIEKIQAQFEKIYASNYELEAFRDRGLGSKEYLAYPIGIIEELVGIYEFF